MSDLTEAERMFMSGAGFGRGGGSAGQGPMGNGPMRMDGKGNLSRGAGPSRASEAWTAPTPPCRGGGSRLRV